MDASLLAGLHAYVMKIVLHMATLQELEDIFNDYDVADILRGQMVAGALAVFAASNLEG